MCVCVCVCVCEITVVLFGIAAMTSWINIKMNKFTANKHMKQLQDNNGDCFYPLCSPFRSSWRPGHPSYQTTSRESSIQRRRSCGMQQFAAGHSYCIKTLCSFKNLLKTHLFSIHFNYLLNFEKRMMYGALVVTLWTCYGAL